MSEGRGVHVRSGLRILDRVVGLFEEVGSPVWGAHLEVVPEMGMEYGLTIRVDVGGKQVNCQVCLTDVELGECGMDPVFQRAVAHKLWRSITGLEARQGFQLLPDLTGKTP